MTKLRCSPARATFMRAKSHTLLLVVARYSTIRTKLLAKVVLHRVLASPAKWLPIDQGRLCDPVWSFVIGITQSLI